VATELNMQSFLARPSSAGARRRRCDGNKEITMATDPVCRMTVDPARAAAQSVHEGETYYFCAVGCKQKFDREPEKYLAGGSSPMR
jgi:Cu+-exporting ATPase